MAKTKKEKQPKETAIAQYTMIDEKTKVQVLKLNALEPKLRKEVLNINAHLLDAMQRYAASYIEIGKWLTEAYKRLEPMRIYVAYVNGIPGMSIPTSYRYRQIYENAVERFSKPVLDAVLATGMNLIGITKEQPYGKYTDVVKRLPPPKSPTPQQAREWVAKVENAYKQAPKRKAKVTDPTELQRRAFRTTVQAYAKLPPAQKKVNWFRDLFAYVLDNVGFNVSLSIEPKPAPTSWEAKKTEEKEEEE